MVAASPYNSEATALTKKEVNHCECPCARVRLYPVNGVGFGLYLRNNLRAYQILHRRNQVLANNRVVLDQECGKRHRVWQQNGFPECSGSANGQYVRHGALKACGAIGLACFAKKKPGT